MLVEAIFGLAVAYLIWSIIAMELNYRRAFSYGYTFGSTPGGSYEHSLADIGATSLANSGPSSLQLGYLRSLLS